MAPQELIALEACSIGIRAELNASEVNSDHASRALAVPPCQLPKKELPCKADPKRASVNILFSRPIEARDFERHATQRGCNFNSPELTVGSELCHAPSAQQGAPAWRNMLF